MPRCHVEKCGGDEGKVQSHPSSEDGRRQVLGEVFYSPGFYQFQWPARYDVARDDEQGDRCIVSSVEQ